MKAGILTTVKIAALAMAAWLATGGQAGTARAGDAPSEYQVKAAILFNFSRFVDWPDDAFSGPSSPIVIGILGEDPFGKWLDTAKNKTIKGRAVQVRRFETVQAASGCHILFISRSESRQLSSILAELRGSGMLLVSDMEKFAQRGGMINLVTQNDTVDFEINVDAVTRAGVKISPRLLNMAHIVRESKSGTD